MIFFVGNDGTVTNSVPSPVYQGSAGANDIYLIAPFAVNLQVTVAFKLPNGVWTERYLMTQIAEIKGAINEKTGKPYIGWRFSLPNEITQYYGTVTMQFFFYTGNSGVITATSAASFTVGRGVPEVLPAKPTDDIYNQIIDNLSVLSGQVENGAFAARAIYAWNSIYKYGANEITFYPEKGKFGAFIKSLIDNNLQPPYSEDGTLNAESWEEVVSFDHIADGYFTELKNLVEAAAGSEANAQASAEAAAGSTEESTRQAENAASSATAAMNAQTVATEQATAAANSAAQASVSEQNALNSATGAESAKQAAQASATEAHGWADIAKQWADYGIKINTEYTSLEELPDPGDSRFIYLIPNGGMGENSYDEYIWADSKSAYEKIGTTEIDLTAYATKVLLNEETNARQAGDAALQTSIAEVNARIDTAAGVSEPLMDGAASAGTSVKYAREDHRHPSDTTKLSLTDWLDIMFPVGGNERYIQFPKSQTPAEKFAGTTWEIDTTMQGRTLIGSGGEYAFGATGGSADAVIVQHTHKTYVDGTNYNENTTDPISSYAQSSDSNLPYALRNAGTIYNWKGTTNEVGETGNGKNMPPYLVVNYWKRIA